MPSPNMARGLLKHFPRGADPPATDQRASPPPVRSPKFWSLRAISASVERGARGGISSLKDPRDGGGGGGGVEERNREGEGAKNEETGAETRTMAETKMTMAQARGGRG